ncbi:hypothetical protein COS31_01120 [Candidatus Roizmanbacteria bacterium CG02_land_8_20_14_3_00_36_15]|uniref:Hydrogenase maturation protease n=2 Tax=Candidatus Roizmaniibacteriota TaxID=1752723 RepID=A0A2M8KMM1_9BACT|nr:MAG: hypothetical protein COS51_04490 [Candidatus Roizmanbacteria bacterium CG03_land_8_20_14_0_80_36_21]PIV38106.1 MAG: hypothetical protein COS31_01120 [Candidatus Roizmanbacteria bacterium CG02_land_8_20_14_3_00_36_15]PIY70242.1 MAG: hypothetical protein COY89_02135 [Candidatus Roizmanbacteria bacterium CG_4_10_14_0_8_um_filter_36_36]PJA52504.1 MAG: hypothetical protein CO166_05590 [Candidatus Roizmanbacteria bacterium CG_4_9_14_3_um_filter_36_11]PJC81761.1 MAG: hypothetical protein CO007
MQNYNSKLRIYVFGNLLVKEDSSSLKLLPELQKKFPKIEFIVVDPNENFPPAGEKDLIILDTVLGIKEPMILNLDNFQKQGKTPVSPHDYDLLFHLLLLKKIRKLNKVRIISIPIKRRGTQSYFRKITTFLGSSIPSR